MTPWIVILPGYGESNMRFTEIGQVLWLVDQTLVILDLVQASLL